MNFIYRALSEAQEQTTPPAAYPVVDSQLSNLGISSLIQQNRLKESLEDSQEESESIGLFSSVGSSVYSDPDNNGFLDLSLQTQAFGPIPTGLGISEKGDLIRVNTATLEGTIDCGEYQF